MQRSVRDEYASFHLSKWYVRIGKAPRCRSRHERRAIDKCKRKLHCYSLCACLPHTLANTRCTLVLWRRMRALSQLLHRVRCNGRIFGEQERLRLGVVEGKR